MFCCASGFEADTKSIQKAVACFNQSKANLTIFPAKKKKNLKSVNPLPPQKKKLFANLDLLRLLGKSEKNPLDGGKGFLEIINKSKKCI